MRILLLFAVICFSFLCRAADTTISWPEDYQEKLAEHISAMEPTVVKCSVEESVVSFSRFNVSTSGYGTDELTFESIWQSLSVTDGYLGLILGQPPFRMILR